MSEMITGARKDGAVRHYMHSGAQFTLCGRYVIIGAGESLRDCKSCVRVGKLVTQSNASDLELLAAQRYNGNVAHVREVIAKPLTSARKMFLREILADTSGDLDESARALYMLWLEYAPNGGVGSAMWSDPKRNAPKGGGNVIDPKNARPARSFLTDNQRNALNKMSAFENSLIKEIRELEGKECPELPLIDLDQLTTRTAVDKAFTSLSASIDKLKARRSELKRNASVSAPRADVITVGMYKVGDDIYKVKPTQAGKLWAHKLIGSTEDGFRFEFVGAPSRFVKADQRMTLEEAKRFGQITGTCCVCSRMLTDEHSIAEGIGPICAEKF